MKKKCVLISGPTIASDQKLGNEIQKYAVVLTNPDNRQLFSILKEEKIELILFEIVKENLADIEFIREAKSNFPDILIILIDGNRLSRLMIDYDIGVYTEKNYMIKKIDSDFFEDL